MRISANRYISLFFALLLAISFAAYLCSCGKTQTDNLSTALNINGVSVSVNKTDDEDYQLCVTTESGQNTVVPLYTSTAPVLNACDDAVLGCGSAFYLLFPDEASNGSFMRSRFYGLQDGKPYVIAEGFGLETTGFYYAAISENGFPLLAVNLTYAADGRHAAYIYMRNTEEIRRAEFTGGTLKPCEDGEHSFIFEAENGEDSFIDISDLDLDWEVFAETYTDDQYPAGTISYTRAIVSSPSGAGEFLADGQGIALSSVYPYLYADLEDWKSNAIRYSENGKIGFLNRKTGERVTEAVYSTASEMKYGSAIVSESDGLFYYISTDGEKLFPDMSFTEAYPFESQGDFARVKLDNGWAILSYKGEIMLQGYQKLNPLPEVSSIASGVDAAGYAKIINVDLHSVYELELDHPYTDIDEFYFDFTLAYKGELVGIVSCEGKTLLPPEYKSIEYCSYYMQGEKTGNILLLQGQDNKYGLAFLQNDGQIVEITGVEYDSIDIDPHSFVKSSDQIIASRNGSIFTINLEI